jgi:hypothetical protein
VHFTSTFKLLIFIKLNIILLKTLLPLSVGEHKKAEKRGHLSGKKVDI